MRLTRDTERTGQKSGLTQHGHLGSPSIQSHGGRCLLSLLHALPGGPTGKGSKFCSTATMQQWSTFGGMARVNRPT